ncbi:MAG: cobalt transporter [Rhodobacteraceae bacterium]|nr:MAG: cobalt transporter [Paracoccaceae bacterium]
MFSRILTSALFAGAAAGLIAALLQLVFVQPVLLHAELYESGQLIHFGGAGGQAVSAAQDVSGFQPVRDGLSILFNMLTYTGFAFMLVGAMLLAERRGHQITTRSGLLWGLAGFVTFLFAPGFSLPPEVPGVAAADVAPRQVWWVGTVIATAIAMWLIAYGRNWAAWGAAIVLLALPQLIGAPEPASYAGPVPPELGALFTARAFGVAVVGWIALGTFATYFWQREGERLDLQTA